MLEIAEESKIEKDPLNPDTNGRSIATQKPELTGLITFKNVYFRYKGSKNYTLKNVNCTINAKEAFALVGGSGSGKSTMVSLILRFYDVTKGQILFDDYDIKTIDLVHLRESIGVVSQEPLLFNGSIRYNIEYNK